jgi:hypothetical protein
MVDLDSFFIKDSNAASNKPYFRGFIVRVLVREGETSTGLFCTSDGFDSVSNSGTRSRYFPFSSVGFYT